MGEVLSEQQRAFLEASHGAVMDDLAEYRAAMVSGRRLVDVLTPEWVYPSSR